MNRMNRAASAIVLVTLVGCGGGSDTPPAGPPATATGCVAGTERITKISGDGQTAAPGALLPERPTVRVTCESFANRGTTMPMAGATVQWQVLTRGLVDGATNVQKQLDADGTTSVAWTLPNGFGTQAVQVNVGVVSPPLRAEFSALVDTSTTTAQSCQSAGGTDHGAATVIAADTAWTAAGSPHRGGTMMLDNAAVLSIEAGAVVCVAAIDKLGDTGAVIAEGTAQAPIRFFGTALRIADVLTHVRAENVPTVGSARPASRIEDSTFRWTVPRDPLMCAQIVVSGSNSGAEATLRRTHIEGYGSAGCAALRLIQTQNVWDYGDGPEFSVRVVGSVGDAVSVQPGTWVNFTACEVSGSGRHGIVVSASTDSYVGIAGCNLFDNDGDAVVNQATVSVRARGNWWGDAAGPGGPNGDGVSGLVDASDPLAALATLDYWAGPPVTAAGCVAGTERITKISGDGQTAAPGALLPERPTVRVTCESFANRGTTMPVAGAAVQWQVLTRGLLDGATNVQKQLDTDGITSVVWTLPNGFGAQAVRVTVAGVSPPLLAEFSATVTATTTTAQSCQDAGGTDHGAATVIAADTAWTAAGSPHRGGTMMLDNAAVLAIEAGAVVCVAAIDQRADSGTVLAEGTSSAPIRFFGTALRVADVLTHVRAENVPTVGSARPASHIADSTFRWSEPRDPLLCAQIAVGDLASGAEATLRRSLIAGYGSPDCAALRVTFPQNYWDYGYGPEFSVRVVDSIGDAVLVDPGSWVNFTACEVSGSKRHGIVVDASTDSYVGIAGCNLFANAGDAVVNHATVSVRASGNWWGDAAGPGGPNGDRVSGLVDAALPLAAPVTLGY